MLHDLFDGYFIVRNKENMPKKIRKAIENENNSIKKNLIYGDWIIDRIKKGKVIDLNSLNFFYKKHISSLIRKCTEVNYRVRETSVHAIITKIDKLLSLNYDIRLQNDSVFFFTKNKTFRLEEHKDNYKLSKSVNGGNYSQIKKGFNGELNEVLDIVKK